MLLHAPPPPPPCQDEASSRQEHINQLEQQLAELATKLKEAEHRCVGVLASMTWNMQASFKCARVCVWWGGGVAATRLGCVLH